MMLLAVKSFLFSAPARVYTLRALLLSCILTTITSWLSAAPPTLVLCILVATVAIICHHILVLFLGCWNIMFLDILFLLGEIGVFIVAISRCLYQATPVTMCFLVNVGILLLSLSFRIAGIIASPHRIWLDFLAGCRRTHRPYTPGRIIFGRSLFRPLLRGESRIIGVIRACILMVICLGIPLFGIYTVIIVPLQSQIIQRNVKLDETNVIVLDKENITILLEYRLEIGPPTQVESSRFLGPEVNIQISDPCHLSSNETSTWDGIDLSGSDVRQISFLAIATCPFSWTILWESDNDIIVTANFSHSTTDILYVTPGQGDPSDVMAYSETIPVISGSHLSASLRRSQRQVFSNSVIDLLGFATPMRSFFATEVQLVQPNPRRSNFSSDNLSLRLRLSNIRPQATRVVQDYVDASVVGGLATLGGFWTFVNGAFTMFFGANLLYFLLQRRPLSALGLMHIFQRQGLVQNWHEDFPALRTEGGLPGSKSAGIVAFIRERLVDLDEEEIESTEKDNEVQIPSPTTNYQAVATSETGIGMTSSNDSGERPETVDPLSGPPRGHSRSSRYLNLLLPRPELMRFIVLQQLSLFSVCVKLLSLLPCPHPIDGIGSTDREHYITDTPNLRSITN
ncbi:hypothetical protein C8J56DRAFT_1048286 [Mycena floridula]|nr:hypothetical protein C8J56DRAFT_1048286 [Mycena floridula]